MEVNFFSGPEFRNEVEEIIESLMSESDRGAVLVASSMIEEGLMELISAFLLPSVNTKDELFHGPSAPLSTLRRAFLQLFALGF